MYYMFPFEKIEKGANIVLYGAGRIGRDYIDQIEKTKYCNIVSVLDMNFAKVVQYCGYIIHPPEDVKSIENYDYILISVQAQAIANQIKELLLSLGVPKDKILHFNKRYVEPEEESEIPLIDLFEKYPIGGKSSDIYKEYIQYCEDLNYILRNKNRNKYFVEITDAPYKQYEDDTKILAWYLPQYYKIEVNDKHYGLGFTEWMNTTRTIPLFTGHYQPRLPYDMGFYNLTDVEIIKRQIELAKMYGIYGFCFHYYWFSGVRTMEEPIELFLKHKELDIKFCIHWCTENWTTRWDGQDKNIIFEQKLADDDDEKFMRDILPYMKDERYIKIDGRPILQIYRISEFEIGKFIKLMQNFRKYAKKFGFPDLYIMLTDIEEFSGNLNSLGIDAVVEWPPRTIAYSCPRNELKGYTNRYFKAKKSIFDVESFLLQNSHLSNYAYENIFQSALVNFDSSPRKASSSSCWLTINSTPLNFKKWLKNIIQKAKKRRREENYAFIFAWNEWAESAYLEPDLLYGYAYLQAVKDAILETRPIRNGIILDELKEKKNQGINKFCFYIQCVESIGDIVACEPITRYLKNLEPDSKLVWIVRKYATEVVRWNPYIDEIIEVDNLFQSINIVNEKRRDLSNIIINCHFNGRKCSGTGKININMNNPQINETTYFDYGPLLTNFCLTAGLNGLNDAPVFYQKPDIPVPAGLPKKYVVFHCTSSERIKDWEDKKWNDLAELFFKDGYGVIEVGLEPVVITTDKNYYDYTSINSIQTIAEIIKNAVCFIGIDSLFAHIANCFNVYGIILLGKYKNFHKYIPYTGNYANDSKASIIYAKDGLPARDILVDSVYTEFKRFLEEAFI